MTKSKYTQKLLFALHKITVIHQIPTVRLHFLKSLPFKNGMQQIFKMQIWKTFGFFVNTEFMPKAK
jgi:hypothetical protein